MKSIAPSAHCAQPATRAVSALVRFERGDVADAEKDEDAGEDAEEEEEEDVDSEPDEEEAVSEASSSNSNAASTRCAPSSTASAAHAARPRLTQLYLRAHHESRAHDSESESQKASEDRVRAGRRLRVRKPMRRHVGLSCQSSRSAVSAVSL